MKVQDEEGGEDERWKPMRERERERREKRSREGRKEGRREEVMAKGR